MYVTELNFLLIELEYINIFKIHKFYYFPSPPYSHEELKEWFDLVWIGKVLEIAIA